MAFKEFQLDDGSAVTIYKRRASRSLRLSITADGKVRVTIPTWASYASGLRFAQSRASWIDKQKTPSTLLKDGQLVGKAHHLHFVPSSTQTKTASRIKAGDISVTYPESLSPSDASVQTIASKACIRALRSQAETLLPQRLASLAEKYGFSYKSVSVKQLKSRWGSCDHQQNIVLNLFLMQLPWNSIDYVLLHELTHTAVMRHGPDFWAAMEQVLPSVKQLRKQMRDYKPVLHSPADVVVAY